MEVLPTAVEVHLIVAEAAVVHHTAEVATAEEAVVVAVLHPAEVLPAQREDKIRNI